MATVADILKALGGVKTVAAKTGIPATTIYSWKQSEYVPHWRIPALTRLRGPNGETVSADDFPVDRPSSGAAA